MAHYICTGTCEGVLEELGFCETEACSKQWTMMEACSCVDGTHGRLHVDSGEAPLQVKDSNGTELHTGDEVVLIKDLTLRGSSRTFKRGTKARITLTDNPEEVDCKLDGTAIVLRVEFLKKL